MFGRRRLFLLGAAIFAVFSVIGGAAPSVAVLLGSRAIMGIGGAMMWPAILGMTYAILPKSKAGLAGGFILGAAGFGNAVGPLLGGVLTDTIGWRWIFYCNLPIAAFAMLATIRVVPDDTVTNADHRLDYAGMAALSAGLIALLLALDDGADVGWTHPRILALFVAAAVALAVFVIVERRAGASALVPSAILENRVFLGACIAVLLMSAIFSSALLYLPQFMTKSLRYDAMSSGTGLLPLMGVFAVTSFVAGPLYQRLGPRMIVSMGAACLAIGIFLLSRITATSTYGDLVPGMIIVGLGVGLFYSSVTTAAVTALDPSQSSLAGGIVYMFQIAGGSIGLGLNTALVVTAPSLTDGIHTAFLVDTALALGGLVVSILYVHGPATVDKAQIRTRQHHHRAHGP